MTLVGCSQEIFEVTTTTKPSTTVAATTTTTTTTTEVLTTSTTQPQTTKAETTTAVETRVVKSIDVDSLCIETPVSITVICLYGTTTSACALNANLESVGGKIHFCETHVSKAEAGRANFGYISIGNATPYLNGFPVYITIQYTKTTD